MVILEQTWQTVGGEREREKRRGDKCNYWVANKNASRGKIEFCEHKMRRKTLGRRPLANPVWLMSRKCNIKTARHCLFYCPRWRKWWKKNKTKISRITNLIRTGGCVPGCDAFACNTALPSCRDVTETPLAENHDMGKWEESRRGNLAKFWCELPAEAEQQPPSVY